MEISYMLMLYKNKIKNKIKKVLTNKNKDYIMIS